MIRDFVPERCGHCGRLTGAVADLSRHPVQLVLADNRAALKHDMTCDHTRSTT